MFPVFTLLLYSPDHSHTDPEFFALLKSFFVRCVLVGVTTIMASKWESYVCIARDFAWNALSIPPTSTAKNCQAGYCGLWSVSILLEEC